MTAQSMVSRGVVLVIVAPAVAFVLHDLIFQLPDNQHEGSPGFFVTVLGLLFAWGLGGYLAGRRTPTIRARAIAGAATAIASVGILWFTFFALNRMFPERMSYEPDRIRAFQASGYPTMREYLAHQGSGPFPLLMVVAMAVGAASSLVGFTREHDGSAYEA